MSDNTLQTIAELAASILTPVFLAILVYAFKQLSEFIALKIGDQKLAYIISQARMYVQAAEQSALAGYIVNEGKAKRDWVFARLEADLLSYGYKIDLDKIYAVIEAQVFSEFDWKKEVRPPIEPGETLPEEA